MRTVAYLLSFLFLVSCVTHSAILEPGLPVTQEVPTGQDAISRMMGEDSPSPEPDKEQSPFEIGNVAAIENLTIDEVIRLEEPNTQNLYDNSRYDFPITMNSKVEGWIDYFTGRGRPHMERYLGRSSRYVPVMKKILKESGLPEDLVYLALIESGFNLRARSRARAVGPWQFIKGTGKRYGLKVDPWVDERRDPIRSTQAAANYLKDLYLMFESWYLAAAAYNAGEYKILRTVDTLKTNNYWRICETKQLRRETRDYIPKLISAAIIAKNPERYGFGDVAYLDPLEFEEVEVNFPLTLRDLANIIQASEEDLWDLNPELLKRTVPPSTSHYTLRVPSGTRIVVERSLDQLKANRLPTQLASNNIKSSARERLHNDLEKSDFITHTVRPGESLWSISEKYNCTVQQLFRWNDLKRSRIHPGRKLKIKGA